MQYDYEWFKQEIFKLTSIDLNAYKEQQMKRRIESLILRNNLDGYYGFYRKMLIDKELKDIFLSYITINVSEFYRNPEQWEVLEKNILPELIKKNGKKLTVWSAACSTGDEPYTLVMILAKFIPIEDVKVIATDLDKNILDKARIGIYDERCLAGLPGEYKTKYFTKVGDKYEISPIIKSKVTFKQHNLLKDDYIKNCDFIACRNVLIYFTEEAKNDIFSKIKNSLKKNGVFFIGSTEQISNYKVFDLERKEMYFYGKS